MGAHMILLTGAAGGLCRLVAAGLVARGVPFVAGTREPERLRGELPSHIPLRKLDLDDPDSVADAFDGVTTVLLISAGYGEPDHVIARHRSGLDAATKAGVRHAVYTSLTGAGDHLAYALPHRWTERYLADGPLAWTVLRNGLYAELLVPDFTRAAATGVLAAPLGDGTIAAVARADLADVAMRVVTEAEADSAEHAGRTYELVGTTAIGGAEVAVAAGPAVTYHSTRLGQLRDALNASGMPGFEVAYLASTYAAAAAGFLADTHAGTGADLTRLLPAEPRDPISVIRRSAGPRAA
jgi:NAD(P)H dehydrogenase (quinone)